jgi:hypothetical protein
MQGWVVIGAWAFAIVFAVVLLGFAAYELVWKTRRLAADQAKLQLLAAQLGAVGSELQAAAERLR